MAVARRRFVGLLAGIAAALVVPAFGLAGRAIPARCVGAIRSGSYPIPFKRLRSNEVSKPGRWRG
jgi:hypothetical protein